jgi:hypothetical protein
MTFPYPTLINMQITLIDLINISIILINMQIMLIDAIN